MERRMPVSDYDPIFEEAAREWNVDPALLRSIAHQESGGNRNAKSSAGARGVMQIMPPTGADLGVTDFSDPAQSIFAGAKYMRQMLDQFKEPALAVAAYNAGPQRIADWQAGKGALPKETAAYVPAVSAHYAKFTKSAASAPAGKDDSGVPSDEDFLKQVAPKSEPKAAPVPNDDDFLKGVGAAPHTDPQKPADETPEGDPEFPIARGPEIDAVMGPGGARAAGVVEDALNSNKQPLTGEAAADAQRGQRVIDSVADAYTHSQNPLMTDKLKGVLEQSDFGKTIAVPALDYAGRAIRGGMAVLGAGVPAVIGEVAGKYGLPGRDLNLLAQDAGATHMMGEGAVPREAPKAPKFVGEHFGEVTPADTVAAPLSQEFRANPLTPAAAEKVAAIPQNPLTSTAPASPVPTMTVRPPSAVAPQGGDETASGPRSVGAAASRDMTAPEVIEAKTPAQAARDLDTSVRQTAADRAGPQGVDNEVHVPGVERKLAAREFSPENSRNEKTLRAQDPEFDKQMRAQDKSNNDVMVDHYNHHAGDAISLDRERDALRDLAPDKQKVFADQKPVDAQPVVDTIDQILSGPAAKQEAVRNTLEKVKKSLYDAGGNLESMPDMLYGVRKNITDKLNSKATDSMAADAKAARAHLTSVLDQLDKIIPQGAPKFKDYLSNYAEQAKIVDAQKFLQDQLSGAGKITDAQGNLRHAQVQKLLEKVAAERKKPGNSPAKSLTDEQVQALIDIRNELAAKAYKDELARAPGSDTAQNKFTAGNIAKGVLKKAGTFAIKGPLAYATHGVSTVLDNLAVKPVMEAVQANKVEKATQELKNRLLQTNSRSNPLNP
jgi:hypothetical protein